VMVVEDFLKGEVNEDGSCLRSAESVI
jgi:hypothetical protein